MRNFFLLLHLNLLGSRLQIWVVTVDSVVATWLEGRAVALFLDVHIERARVGATAWIGGPELIRWCHVRSQMLV